MYIWYIRYRMYQMYTTQTCRPHSGRHRRARTRSAHRIGPVVCISTGISTRGRWDTVRRRQWPPVRSNELRAGGH
ncbi:hypothetical protein Kisp02_57630 [Kineosporia sp. NBRC 101731]|nr:hypothetical protein Kisp02_57630 [Kineosporia sp. NBRC 101731]